jgi:hypothetical protein
MNTSKKLRFNVSEREAIISHCLWNISADDVVRRLLDSQDDALTIRIVGHPPASPISSATLTIRVPKSEAIRIFNHPLRETQSQLAAFGYRETLNCVFSEDLKRLTVVTADCATTNRNSVRRSK